MICYISATVCATGVLVPGMSCVMCHESKIKNFRIEVAGLDVLAFEVNRRLRSAQRIH
jgi:hypothetical protein